MEENVTRTWTEAPSSATIRCTIRGYSVLFTLRNDSGRELLPKLDAAITALEKLGAKPNGYQSAKPSGGDENAPMCPTHGTKMLPSQHGSGWYCPKKVADDDGTGKPVYCKQRSK